MLLCRLINKCCSRAEKGSVQFYFPIFCLPLSHSLLFILFRFVFRVSFLQTFFLCFFFSPLNPVNGFFANLCLCFFVVFIFSRLILLFHKHIQSLELKMCLRDPYLIYIRFLHIDWCWSVYGAFYTHTLTNTTKFAFNFQTYCI